MIEPSQKPFLITIPAQIAPGGDMEVNQAGEFVHVLEADQQYFAIIFDDASYATFGRATRYKCPAGGSFGKLRIRNTSATLTLNVWLNIGFGDFVDDRTNAAGPRSITGTMGSVNAPLTTEGGVITPMDGTFFENEVTSAALGVARTTIVASGANPRGIILHMAFVDFYVIGHFGSYASITAYNGVSDSLILKSTQRGSFQRERNLWVPPGVALCAVVGNVTAVSSTSLFTMNYKVL